MFRASSAAPLVAMALVGGAMLPAAGPGRTGTAAAKPANFQVLINGKRLTQSQMMAAADTLLPVRSGSRISGGARWANDPRNAGYYVLVSDMGSTDRRRCTIGTSYLDEDARRGDGDGVPDQDRPGKGKQGRLEQDVCVVGA